MFPQDYFPEAVPQVGTGLRSTQAGQLTPHVTQLIGRCHSKALMTVDALYTNGLGP